MARKTKAELVAEQQEREAAREAHDFALYPTLLLDALEMATLAGFTLSVVNKEFVVYAPMSNNEYKLPPQHTKQAMYDVAELNWETERVAEERAESERRYAVKQAALAKLSKEEKELLGL